MDTLKKVNADEHVILAQGGSEVLGDTVTVTAAEPGFVRVDFDASTPTVMLRITEAIELHDGDFIAAGSQWLAFEAGTGGEPPQLSLLEHGGDVQLTFTLTGPSWSLGRVKGDVVLARDSWLSSRHLQVLVRPEGIFLQDLGSSNGTWTVVRSGEQLPAGSVLLVGDRAFRVSAPPAPAVHEPSEDDCTWPIDLHSAA